MTRALQISDALCLPLRAVTEKLAFLGRTGSGKTYAAQKLAEEMHAAAAQFVVLDPVGVWYGLRLAADGKAPGLPVPVLGGLHGDIPLEPGAGALIANLVVDRGVSMVLDVSQFESDADKARFARAFAERFFFRMKAAPSAVHVFLEECQEFAPQNHQRGEEGMLHAFTRLVKIGRNYGIGVSLISQRPQEVNKKVLNLTELLFCFQLTGPQERKTIDGWIAEKGIDEDIAGELPKLEVGHAHVWSPAWLKISKVVGIARKTTYDVSRTPTVGAKAATRALSPIDLERLRTDMAATIEKAKAEDPRELRRRIVELERELKHQKTVVEPAGKLIAKIKEKRVEVPVLKDAHVKRIEVTVCNVDKLATRTLEAIAQMTKSGEALMEFIRKAVKEGQPAPQRAGAAHIMRGAARSRLERVVPAHPQSSRSELPKGERAVLTAVAQHGELGVTREQLTVLTGYKRSSRDTYLQRLGASGLIQILTAGIIAASEAGLDALGPDFEPLPTGAALREYWIRELPEGERRVLAVLLEAYPKAVDREVISEQTDYQRSSRDTYLQRLRARHLVVDAGRGLVKASDTLF
jgi:uncharacterized protein DUF87